MARILITGGAGFIGSAISPLLAEESNLVVIYDRKPPVEPRVHDCHAIDAQLGDIRDFDCVAECVKHFAPTHIFHLAAMHFVPHCEQQPEEAFDINVNGLQTLLLALSEQRCRARIIFVSSAAVYGDSPAPARETDDVSPFDVYGHTKLQAERLLQAHCVTERLPFTILRLFNVYGHGDNTPHVIPHILAQLRDHDEIEVGNLLPTRDFVHISDVASAIYNIFRMHPRQDLFNVGSGCSYSVGEVLQIIGSIVREQSYRNSSFQIRVNPLLKRSKERMRLTADIQRIRYAARWTPRMQLRDGLAQLLKELFER